MKPTNLLARFLPAPFGWFVKQETETAADALFVGGAHANKTNWGVKVKVFIVPVLPHAH